MPPPKKSKGKSGKELKPEAQWTREDDSPQKSVAGNPNVIEETAAEEIDDIVPTRGYQMTPMVGLGGSAGSIAALREFFRAMPAESGMIFVVILHLSPEHHSTLPELLQRETAMSVVQARDGDKALANVVYVIPPGKYLTTVDGHLRLSEIERERGKRVAVDLFFRSLADTHGPHAAAIVLSGADGDGAVGIKRIKERGGLTIAQDPDESEHGSMPRSAIETGMVDWVLRVLEMPQRLVDYQRREGALRLPPEDGFQPATVLLPPLDEDEVALRGVLAFLRTRTGRDFSYYKRATILRRIARRMQVNSVDDLPGYLAFLRTHLGEAGALLQDLLISVTNFFRDRESFDALEKHIPVLFKDKSQSDTVRIWVPACATGEEAYSIAILLLERAREVDAAPSLQVFACDLDDEAIQTARAGFFPHAISADVSEDRLQKFFVKEPGGYRVRRELREMVLFAAHDLLKDPPFSRMDLVSCRNLFIYLNRDAQARVLDIFHFALRRPGRLFLGTSETVDGGRPLFRVLDKKHRIYEPRKIARVGFPMSSGSMTLTRVVENQPRKALSETVAAGAGSPHALSMNFRSPGTEEWRSPGGLHAKLIERVAPPSVIVDPEYEIVHLSENADRFVRFVAGAPTANLLRAVQPSLQMELRAGLLRASETGATVEILGLGAEIDGAPHEVEVRIEPAGELAPGFLLVVFQARKRPEGGPPRDGAAGSSADSESVVRSRTGSRGSSTNSSRRFKWNGPPSRWRAVKSREKREAVRPPFPKSGKPRLVMVVNSWRAALPWNRSSTLTATSVNPSPIWRSS